ncbi:MAG: hypothetical protein WC413_01210 [Candidatus Nanoarchaeia archaeon]
MEKAHEVLVGLTTDPRFNWEDKIKEIQKLKDENNPIKRIAFYPTQLELKDRVLVYKELNKLFKKGSLEQIPHVHLRGDMQDWELELFKEDYGANVFNIHAMHIDVPAFKKYLDMISIENGHKPLTEKMLDKCAGICLDISHQEESNYKLSFLYGLNGLLEKYPIKCCHVSGIKHFKMLNWGYHTHKLSEYSNFEELRYAEKYKYCLPFWVSLELNNSIEEQYIAIKPYLEELIIKKENIDNMLKR